MIKHVIGRAATALPVLFGVSLLVFLMLHLVPGDPVELMLRDFVMSPEDTARIRAQLYFDRPLPEQYGIFIWRAVQGDLGISIRSKRPVYREIADNLPSTIELTLVGLSTAVVIGGALGVIAAVQHNSWFDVASMLMALVGVSMPSFWLGLVLIYIFSLRLGFLPATGGGSLAHLIMPSLTLGLGASAVLARLTRSSMLQVLRQEYIITARAKGLNELTVVMRHGFLNAAIPVITILGLQFGNLLAGAVVVETVFGRPGIGRVLVGAILEKDIPVVQGTVLFIATGYVLVNLIVDLAYLRLDPRIRFG